MKTKIIFVVVLLILAGYGYTMQELYSKEKKEHKRTEANQNALLKKQQQRYTAIINGKDSVQVLTVDQLTLTKKEAKRERDSLIRIVDDLGIRLNRVTSIMESETTVDVRFDAPVKDSIVPTITADNVYLDTMKCIDYADAFNSFSGCIQGDTLRGARIVTNVPIKQVIHRVPKFEWKFIRLGTKGIQQEMFCDNPSATINYAETINFK